MSAVADIPRFSLADVSQWKATWKLEKRHGDWGDELNAGLDHLVDEDPYEVIEREGNLLTNGGVSVLWQCLIGNGTATAGQNHTFFNNAQAAIGVGDSTTSASATQNNLQAASNKLRKAMDATYPQHTSSTSDSAAQTITFRASFGTSEANWVWNEWVVANSATDATGRILNRKVENLGTKSSGTWTLTVTIQIS